MIDQTKGRYQKVIFLPLPRLARITPLLFLDVKKIFCAYDGIKILMILMVKMIIVILFQSLGSVLDSLCSWQSRKIILQEDQINECTRDWKLESIVFFIFFIPLLSTVPTKSE